MKIGILGAGAYGSALGSIIEKNGHTINYYDPPKGLNDLGKVTEGADYIVLCTPVEILLSQFGLLPKNIPAIVATKGFLTDRPFEDFNDYMVVSGPGFADDIKAGKKTLLTATDKRIEEVLGTDFLTFDYTTDRLGVLMCGALKNVYAILAGYLNLERESEPWKNYIKEASEEIQALLLANSANPATFNLACGIGDLELTCGLPSRNYEYGQILRNNPAAKPDKTAEGLAALNKIKNHEIIVPENTTHLHELMKLIP